jgi:hypothetical protein
MNNKSIEYRGRILHAICDLELLLNTYIAIYFCGCETPLSEEMQNVVLGDDRISLSSKAQIFHFLATTHHNEWFKQYVSPRPPEPKKKAYSMNSDLMYVIEQRNIFAHRVLDRDFYEEITNEPTKDGDVRFLKFKNLIYPLDFNDASINDLYRVISRLAPIKLNRLQSVFAIIWGTSFLFLT